MAAALFWSLLGLVVLVGGAELLTRGGMRLASLAGVPPILIGLTIVAVGTSVPELAVGIDAALKGNGSLAVGNVAGTNIVNILLILGLSALLAPLPLEARTIRVDLPVMVAASVVFLLMAWKGTVTRLDGLALLAGAAAYTFAIVRGARRESRDAGTRMAEELALPSGREPLAVPRAAAALVVGIAAVVLGAEWLVDGAVVLAREVGVSDAFIGLTVVAIGTSLPELVTTIVATLRGRREIAVGNLIGSSTYNILLILGLTAALPAGGIVVEPELARIDLPVMVLVAAACIPAFVSGRRLTRLEGGLFAAAYLVYLGYLVVVRG